MNVSQDQIKAFCHKIYDFYSKNKRDFLWRTDITPYNIVVSEIMLQQTQTARVEQKFEQWLKQFSSFKQLAQAEVRDVLLYWQGLGYNRRALALYELAKRVHEEFAGLLPNDPEILKNFKGIGPNTAGSICAFAFNRPVVFIETNIRTVFLHEFFKDAKSVDDKELLPLIESCLDRKNPRDWYYALMDYGVYLKKELKVNNKKSKQYTKQSKFIGSKRQIRGAIVRAVTKLHEVSYDELSEFISMQYPDNKHELFSIIQDLDKEGFLKEVNGIIRIL